MPELLGGANYLAPFTETGTEQHQEIQGAAASPAVGPWAIPHCLSDV